MAYLWVHRGLQRMPWPILVVNSNQLIPSFEPRAHINACLLYGSLPVLRAKIQPP
ncbi:hypothetical protein M378DRAFT_171973 [Amanita muscaria Koide BX008]|uniref:Uncharacterized protein n=1 Tax=Amanita muscaria (strain Koide BX008) TaxID=946122 RepID=A0A0C2ST65_AMAMK|nr:hypothetical protein M378DRAFT_171973 [Amanita muscaria Koide BX008]